MATSWNCTQYYRVYSEVLLIANMWIAMKILLETKICMFDCRDSVISNCAIAGFYSRRLYSVVNNHTSLNVQYHLVSLPINPCFLFPNSIVMWKKKNWKTRTQLRKQFFFSWQARRRWRRRPTESRLPPIPATTPASTATTSTAN